MVLGFRLKNDELERVMFSSDGTALVVMMIGFDMVGNFQDYCCVVRLEELQMLLSNNAVEEV